MSATSTATDATATARGGFLRSGYPRSFGIGSTFAIAWSPCIGPILGVILTLAATSGSATQGALLLAFYSAGLGVWFLAFGLAFSWIAPKIRGIQRYLPTLLVVSGALFIVVGALMVLGKFGQLNSYFQSFGFLFDQTAAAEETLTGGTSGTAGPLIAFFGGMVSFLSPCVVPLVPVYLANLAGEAARGSSRADRRRVFMHSVAFVVGFGLVFTLIGASVGFVGNRVQEHLDTATRVGGLFLIVFGLQMSGLIKIPFMERTYQLDVN